MSNPLERFDLYLVRDFLDAQTCAELVAEVRAAWGGPATVYRPGAPSPVDERLRRTTRHMLSEETTERVRQLLLARKAEVEKHFGIALKDCEDPQFLRYREGDFFVAHQDGNTEQLQFDHLRVRRVSVVVFLNRQSDEPAPEAFGGGSLVFYEPNVDPARKELGFPLAVEAGLLVAFRAETTHEVVPVTHGERFAIVCWYR
ncbi:MAG TPA: 2OG-Fe(II) oxygenase [Pyrinomonadaceae bacterium]|nr:2OG-Fe(II) oxygenase [Pyrinomonadaceae bacterium]